MHWARIILQTSYETMAISAPTFVENAFGRVDKEVCDRRLQKWAARGCEYADVRVTVEGDEHLDAVRAGETFVVISNHQSTYDIFVVMHTFPGSLRMVAKYQMFRIPIMGPAMKASHFVLLDRGNSERARRALDDAITTFDAGINIWIAPEGTRSKDGRLLPFKKGGFMLALKAKQRILPVTLVDTNTVLPSKGYRVRRGRHVSIRYHAPIDPAEYGIERRDELVADVRAQIVSGQPAHLR